MFHPPGPQGPDEKGRGRDLRRRSQEQEERGSGRVRLQARHGEGHRQVR